MSATLEHPDKQLAASVGATLRVIPVDDSGQLRLDVYARLLSPRTKLVAVTQVSNVLGTVTPVREIAALAHAQGATVLVDGAQAVSHLRVDVQDLDADFYVFSGHKVFGPNRHRRPVGQAGIARSDAADSVRRQYDRRRDV